MPNQGYTFGAPLTGSPVLSDSEAAGRVARSKIPTIDIGLANVHQVLIDNAATAAGTPLPLSGNVGCPVVVRLFISVSAACNFTVFTGNSKTKLFHDAGQDITIGAAGDKIVDIKTGGYFQLTPSANVTATVEAVALYY